MSNVAALQMLDEIAAKVAELDAVSARLGLLSTAVGLPGDLGGDQKQRAVRGIIDLREDVAGIYADLVVLIEQARQQFG